MEWKPSRNATLALGMGLQVSSLCLGGFIAFQFLGPYIGLAKPWDGIVGLCLGFVISIWQLVQWLSKKESNSQNEKTESSEKTD